MIRNLFAALITAFALNAFAAVDANRANQADLETVKGIGPALSGKIIEARKAGEFKNWGDLVERIGGVGPGSAARLSQAGLTVAGAAYDPSAMPAAPAKAGKADKAAKSMKPAKAEKATQAAPAGR
jgi:competence protein ComEA